MSSHGEGSTAGAVAAFVLGGVVGLAVGYPALPAFSGFDTELVGSSPGAVGSALLVGALVVLLLPFVMLALYQTFALLDR